MVKKALAAGLAVLFSSAAWADRLVLTDGREFEGVVTVQIDGSALIVMEYGTLSFPKHKISRIELKDTPQQELAKRLEQVAADDPQALFSVAQWADRTGLKRRATGICEDVLKLDPDHDGARAALGYVRVDDTWRPLNEAVTLARSKLEAGQYDLLLTQILPAMEPLARSYGRLPETLELTGMAQLRAKKFTAAARTFATLANSAQEPSSLRYGAITAVLRENPDGMYVLTEPFPRDAGLLSTTAPVAKAGPASLSRPEVLAAALRDRAKPHIAQGRRIMEAAQALENTDAKAAHLKYQQASRALERANAVTGADVGGSYQVQIVRRRIAMVQREIEPMAAEFDRHYRQLGEKPVPPQIRLEMLRLADSIAVRLKEILALAQPYRSKLALEIMWAEKDLRMLDITREELKKPSSG